MSSFFGKPSLRPTSAGVRLARASPAERREALAVLLTGRRRPDDPAVDPFLEFAREHELRLDDLWGAWEGPRLAAAALIVPGVGATGMLFVSPVASSGRAELAGRLVAQAVRHVDGSALHLLQTLLEPGQDLQRRAIEAGGFHFLAELIYMQRAGKPLAELPPVMRAGKPLRVTPWSEARRPAFAQAIAASYEGTLDCPGLLGLREMDDIIAGHMATGRFDPRHWTLYRDGDQPLAVMLLAEATNGSGMELVYLGLTPAARGQGLATTLMHHALDAAAGCGHGKLFLAVDAANRPALKLYRGLGFRSTVRKTALIFTPGRPCADE